MHATGLSASAYDWLVVGAGLSGATLAERIASQLDRRVLVIDRRPHVGGNAHDSLDEAGVLVHRYGPHIFHTSSGRVWRYLSRFTDWLPYEHRVLASIEGKLVPLPFNLNTIDALYPARDAERLRDLLTLTYGEGARVPMLGLLDHPHSALAELGAFVYEKVFLHYTEKQWGLRPEQLDPAVTARVPVLVGRDDRYFRDPYQGIPAEGYTRMVSRMLDHPNITVLLDAPYEDVVGSVRFDRLVFTGPIDRFFDEMHGPLPYRSLRFEHRTLQVPRRLPVAVVNYPNDERYTRVIEHNQFTGAYLPSTTVTFEHPIPHDPGRNEPYYPVPTTENRARYSRYVSTAAELDGRVLFVGRLARYRYYDMDKAVSRALQTFRHEIVDRRIEDAPALSA